MLIFTANTSDKAKLAKIRDYGMGILITTHPDITFAKSFLNNDLEGIPISLDNGAFGTWQNGYGFNPYPFLWTLNQLVFKKIKPEWIVCPDRPANPQSDAFSFLWGDLLGDWPMAFVVQDGMKPEYLSPRVYMRYKVLFVGGTKKWKWETVEEWAEYAKKNNMLLHIGRCGTLKGLERAQEVGADSVDSTNFVRNESWDVIKEFNDPVQQKMEL